MKQIFISYSHMDRFAAELVQLKLESENLTVWRDKSGLAGGKLWKGEIDKAIDSCKVCVLLLSPSSCGSAYVTYEWARGISRDKVIIPLYLENCNIHPKLQDIHYVDFRTDSLIDWRHFLDRVLEAVKDAEETDLGFAGLDNEGLSGEVDNSIGIKKENLARKVRSYLNGRGFQAASFMALHKQLDENPAESELRDLASGDFGFRIVKFKNNSEGLRMI